MTQYQLNFSIPAASVAQINAANQFVTLVKSVNNGQGSSTLPVAWVSFSPLTVDTVTWIENYSVYASSTQLQAGATIVMSSTQAAQTGMLYTFENGVFTGGPGGVSNIFEVSNQNTLSGSFNFGLAQQATINGVVTTAPLNSIAVLYNEDVTFTPIETISVFLSGYQNNGVVMSSVTSQACVVELTSAAPSASLSFNASNNTFYQNTTALMSHQDLVEKLSLAE